MTENISTALRSLIADCASGPVDWAHPQFFNFPVGDGRTVTVFHNDGKFEHGYTGRHGSFLAQFSTIKGLRSAVTR